MNHETRKLIEHSMRKCKPVERWGPYSVVPPIYDRDGRISYVHEVYPVARGWIRNDDGTTRPATSEELEVISRSTSVYLTKSFEGLADWEGC
jgi:hypothetical protein